MSETLLNLLSSPAESPRQCTEEDIRQLMLAARLAPSAENYQTWRFVQVKDEGRKAAVLGAMEPEETQQFLNCPHLFVLGGVKKTPAWRIPNQPFIATNGGIALAHVWLLAREKGIGFRYTVQFDETAVAGAVGRRKKGTRFLAVLGVG